MNARIHDQRGLTLTALLLRNVSDVRVSMLFRGNCPRYAFHRFRLIKSVPVRTRESESQSIPDKEATLFGLKELNVNLYLK